ncbi:MAG: OB-fold nucleic acid binding domain-containing protein [Desulfurococcales archaeon]|nr:OB-fold nucleic acid binding domain-containing protein [Desulfurococcales archaeon]MCE4605655.1 OB-fold nucleic acid binding domain-containing protein [Desulfurococcales archaeon]
MEEERKISSLKEGMDNVSVKGRVISTEDPKVIQTRKGPRRISEAVIGDDTGRVKVTLWGKHAGTLEEGEAVEIRGAWTTSYRGEVQLNVGYKGEIERIGEDEVPSEEDIPENTPKAETGYRRGGYGPRRHRSF